MSVAKPVGKLMGIRINEDHIKNHWDIVGQLFVSAVKEFFSSRKLLKQINAKTLALVPKIPQPSKVTVTVCRPIACCNTVYKCI